MSNAPKEAKPGKQKPANAAADRYRETVFLPATDFAMKAGLPQLEPKLLERWKGIGMYKRMREVAANRPLYVLHDGPPYANGNIHIGTALNKVLKDVIVRSRQMMGFNSNYVPGWDCHGLPIEWKIEEQYRAAGKNKDEVPIVEFRRECREFADHWINVQREEFRRLGVEGDWASPYTTMSYPAEAQIVRECLKFLMNGGLYKGSKPVMWSVVERTALAEAEVEYHDHVSPTVFVKFPLVRCMSALKGASVVIWTTTPWTIPGNRGIAFKEDATYVRIRIDEVAENALARVGDELVIAEALVPNLVDGKKIKQASVVASLTGEALTGAIAAHPFRGKGYDFDVPLLPGDFVTLDTGTGFVHMAPGHGPDDFELCIRHGIEVPFTLDEDGAYYPHVPMFAGKRVLDSNGKDGDANDAVIAALREVGMLPARGKLSHQYPHSWRSKAPVIYRNTPQWFISMATNDLRAKALKAIDEVRWVPPSGRNRLRGMIEQRPDWVISRQRAWGVPITVFEHKKTGEVLRDEKVNERIVSAVEKGGADAWFAGDASRFLAPEYNAADYHQVTDILDVWFDSGSTHSYVLEQRPDLKWPADMYLEGSDQHRGWFHSSLLESCGTRGRAPYNEVLTHGFVLDGEGRKMSKSLGNTVAPQEVVNQHGADILRLWVVSADYSEDLRIGPEIIKAQVDAYRRLRNTLRYLLGNLKDFSDAERVAPADMPELERWVLHRVAEVSQVVHESCEAYDFHRMYVALYTFCSVELSSFYFDIRKDALYCDAVSALRRRAARTVLAEVYDCLTAWLAPILCFTAEEAWLARNPGEGESVHLRTFPKVPAEWRDEALARKWERVRRVRRVVTGALEIERAEKRIGASLQAAPRVFMTAEDADALKGLDFAEICITSAIDVTVGEPPQDAFRLDDVKGVGVISMLANGSKCVRCWQVLPEVGSHADHPELCHRCHDAVAGA